MLSVRSGAIPQQHIVLYSIVIVVLLFSFRLLLDLPRGQGLWHGSLLPFGGLGEPADRPVRRANGEADQGSHHGPSG